ncbi:aliphatic amidase AmiE [Nonlabens ulvanivorans]|uniref:Aliphatic amidase AmiE n=1 Tax=Nonlabens ulvanivorans TaxID=906888 RepID=A0A090WE45_NONUL|nr:aliphatic amidase AmiE [Nonlabens ulvanivorans]
MAAYNKLSVSDSIRELAKYTEMIRNKFSELSIKYNINIITGSMPEIIDGQLYNVGNLCRRDGTIERYEKIHVTPDEQKVWGTSRWK